jgi:hypothetical protein
MSLEATRAFHKMVATCLPLHCRGGRHKTRATRACPTCPTCRGIGRVAHVREYYEARVRAALANFRGAA